MHNGTTDTAFTPDGIITKLFNHADDNEASVLQGLLVKSGYLWRCPECAATFDFDTKSCEYCGTTQPAIAVYEPHCRFEYDLNFDGGSYHRTGTVVYVPFSLMERRGLPPEEAFFRYTGIDPVHIVHYSPDESFDAQGEEYDEEIAETIEEMRELFSLCSISVVIDALAHFCSLNESQSEGDERERWNTAHECLHQALARIVELQKDGQETLPAQLQIGTRTERITDAMAPILERRSIIEALRASIHQARSYASRDGEQHASAWKEAITLIMAPAAETLENLSPARGLNC